MKKAYLLVGMSLISAVTFAQTANVAQVRNTQSKNGAKAGLGFPNTGSANRAVYLTEDFSGTFPPANWTVQSEPGSTTTSPTQKWHLENNGNPGGCASVLYANSVDQHNESIITPPVTLAAGGHYQVSFDFNTSQYWHLPDGVLGGQFDNADITVTVSTDGGTTWSAVLWQEDDQALGEAAYAWPWTQFTWTRAHVNLSAFAGQDVNIRWNYNGMDGAQFNLDNIEVSDIPANDLHVLEYSVGKYSKLPVGQERPSELWARVQNRGYAAQTNVTLEVEENGTSVGTSSAVASLASGAIDSLSASTNYQAAGVGVKNLEFIFSQDEAEEVPADNSVTGTFEISQNTFACDRNVYDGDGWAQFVFGTQPNMFPATGVGVIMETTAEAQATSISVVLDQLTNVGAILKAELYDLTASTSFDDLELVGESDLHTVTAAEINTAATNNPVALRLELFVPADLSADNEYFVVIKQESDTISVAHDASRITNDEVLLFTNGSWGGVIGGEYSTMIRLNVNEGNSSSIKENVSASGISVFPNPASDVVNVKFAEISGDVVMQLFSTDGKQVLARNANVVANQNTTLDVSGLSAGIYTLRVAAATGTYTQKVIVK